MAIAVREEEIQRLVRFYRKAVKDLAKQIAQVDFDSPRMFAQVQASLQILAELDERTTRWAKRNLGKLYRAASREAERDLRRLGLSRVNVTRARAFSVIDDRAIRILLADSETGFLTALGEAVDQVKGRIRTIQHQARLLLSRQRFFNETIARVGILEGQAGNTIRDQLVDEMVGLKNSNELIFTPKAARLPASEIVSNVANLPTIKIPARTATGYRRLRIDKYAELLARTKTSQAANLARRNRLLRHGQALIQISKNKPLQDDACFVYLGKAFALTQAAAEEFGVPHVSQLPNGGAPFHPNCTHQELLFMPEFRREEEVELALQPPPAWALNRPWNAVQKEYMRRGGPAAIAQFNKAVPLTRGTGGRTRRGLVDGDEFGALPEDDLRNPNNPRRPRR